MKTNFERAKEMLATLHGAAPLTTGDDVRRSLDALSAGYLTLGNASAAPVDYSQPATQLAYVYRHLPAHADLIYQALCDGGNTASAAFKGPIARALCVGGGPGSEAVGIFKYVERMPSLPKRLELVSYDHWPSWSKCMSAAAETAPAGLDVSVKNMPADLTADEYWDLPKKLSYDLITFSYCLSEVWRYDTKGYVSAQVRDVVERASAGTIIIYVDNAGSSFDPYAEKIFLNRTDLELLDRSDHTHMLIGSDEQMNVVADFKTWAGNRFPKLKGEATRFTLVKK